MCPDFFLPQPLVSSRLVSLSLLLLLASRLATRLDSTVTPASSRAPSFSRRLRRRVSAFLCQMLEREAKPDREKGRRAANTAHTGRERESGRGRRGRAWIYISEIMMRRRRKDGGESEDDDDDDDEGTEEGSRFHLLTLTHTESDARRRQRESKRDKGRTVSAGRQARQRGGEAGSSDTIGRRRRKTDDVGDEGGRVSG